MPKAEQVRGIFLPSSMSLTIFNLEYSKSRGLLVLQDSGVAVAIHHTNGTGEFRQMSVGGPRENDDDTSGEGSDIEDDGQFVGSCQRWKISQSCEILGRDRTLSLSLISHLCSPHDSVFMSNCAWSASMGADCVRTCFSECPSVGTMLIGASRAPSSYVV